MTPELPVHHQLLIEYLHAFDRGEFTRLAIVPQAGAYGKQRLSGKRLFKILQNKLGHTAD